MLSNIYLTLALPTYAVQQTLTSATTQSGTEGAFTDLITSGGVLTVALTLGWFLLRRSDERETNIRQQLKDDLDKQHAALVAEQEAHQTTKLELIDVLRYCTCVIHHEE